MIRNVTILSALVLIATGCAPEYGVSNVNDSDDDITNVTVTVSDEEENLDDDGCWFGQKTGRIIDSDDDGELDSMEEVGVKTIPVFTLFSPTRITVEPGEEVTLDFSVSSYNECGDMDFRLFFFGVYDFTEDSYEWLKPLNDDAVPSDFEDMDSEAPFPSYAAENMRVTPTGNQLFYAWKDEKSIEHYGETISTQRVRATEERFYRFTWTASDYAPIGHTFLISLTEVGWKDITSGVEVYYDYAPLHQGIEIEVTVVD